MAEAYLIEGAVFQDPEDGEGYFIEGAAFQAGAAAATKQTGLIFTRLGEHGSARHPYGSFAGKSPAPAGGPFPTRRTIDGGMNLVLGGMQS
jgi:hypothetical protein